MQILLRSSLGITMLGLAALGSIPLAAVPAQAQGTVVYDSKNGSPETLGRDGAYLTDRIVANQFILTAPITFNTIEFPDFEGNFYGGMTVTGYAGSLTYQFYSDNQGAPGTLFSSVNTADVTRSAPYSTKYGPGYVNDINTATLTLGPGTYWLGLHNGTLAQTDTPGGFYWQRTSSPTDPTNSQQILLVNPTTGFGTTYLNQDFEFINDSAPVPEAGTDLSLGLLLALGGIVIAARTKSRRLGSK